MYMLPRTPSLRLDGRTAIVAGASRGIGAAAAAALAEAGAAVVLAARSRHDVEAVASALRDAGFDARAVVLDVTDAAAVAAAFAAEPALDIVVNCAGSNRPALITETQDADIDAVLALNVRAALLISREAARAMQAHGRGGALIHMSSQMGHVGGPKRAVYCASKHALEGMTKALAWELGPHGIRVNTVCPTFVLTALTAPMLEDPSFRDFVLGKIALGRLARVEDLMGAIVFLASDASAMVTGSALMVDGGWTAA